MFSCHSVLCHLKCLKCLGFGNGSSRHARCEIVISKCCQQQGASPGPTRPCPGWQARLRAVPKDATAQQLQLQGIWWRDSFNGIWIAAQQLQLQGIWWRDSFNGIWIAAIPWACPFFLWIFCPACAHRDRHQVGASQMCLGLAARSSPTHFRGAYRPPNSFIRVLFIGFLLTTCDSSSTFTGKRCIDWVHVRRGLSCLAMILVMLQQAALCLSALHSPVLRIN